MDDPEHYATPHESLVELLRCMPRRALVELICRAHGTVLGEITQINERTPTIEIPSLLRRARRFIVDLVLTVHTKGSTIVIVIAEAQLSWDATKLDDWSLLQVAFGARNRKKAIVAVFCPHLELRARFRVAIADSLPPPVIIEPEHIELITDDNCARREPHRAILSAIYHADTDEPEATRAAAIRAGLIAATTLEPSEGLRYYLLMQSLIDREFFYRVRAEVEAKDAEKKLARLAHIPKPYHRVFEEGWNLGLTEGLSDGLEQGLTQGREQGLEQGLEQGRLETVRTLRRVLFDMLELRGFVPTTAVSARIQSCDHIPMLELWYTRARTWDPTTPLDDLLG